MKTKQIKACNIATYCILYNYLKKEKLILFFGPENETNP